MPKTTRIEQFHSLVPVHLQPQMIYVQERHSAATVSVPFLSGSPGLLYAFPSLYSSATGHWMNINVSRVPLPSNF